MNVMTVGGWFLKKPTAFSVISSNMPPQLSAASLKSPDLAAEASAPVSIITEMVVVQRSREPS